MKKIYKYHEEGYIDIICLIKSLDRNRVACCNSWNEYFYTNDRRIEIYQDNSYSRKKHVVNFFWLLEKLI